MPQNKRILFAIMGWGLGHATRCIPLIQSLMKDNHVILASNGISSILLQQEFPDKICIDYPDYAVKYPKNRIMLLPLIALQLPSIIIKLTKEYLQTQNVVKDNNIAPPYFIIKTTETIKRKKKSEKTLGMALAQIAAPPASISA